MRTEGVYDIDNLGISSVLLEIGREEVWRRRGHHKREDKETSDVTENQKQVL